MGGLSEKGEQLFLPLLQKAVEFGVGLNLLCDGRDDRNLLYQYILNWDVDTNYLCAFYCSLSSLSVTCSSSGEWV